MIQLPVPPPGLPTEVREYLNQVANYLTQVLGQALEPGVVRGYSIQILNAPRSGIKLSTGMLYADQDSIVRIVTREEAWIPKAILKVRTGSMT